MQTNYPTSIQSSVNGSLDLFTGIFYVIRILGAGQGQIRPSTIVSPNGGVFLEQDIFSVSKIQSDAFWYFESLSTSNYYKWGSHSQPHAKVGWTAGDSDYDYPLQLRNLSDISQDIYEDPTNYFWEFEPFTLSPDFGDQNGEIGYKLKATSLLNSISSSSVSFGNKSPRGWWLQINQHELESQNVDRQSADQLLMFEPQNFKLYLEISSIHFKDVSNSHQEREYINPHPILRNPGPKEIIQNVTMGTTAHYNLYFQPDKDFEFDHFSGVTVELEEITPSRIYIDVEGGSNKLKDGVLNLIGSRYLKTTEEIEIEPFSTKNISSYINYVKEFGGIRYHSWATVSVVVDIMGSNGAVVKNVLVKDMNVLKHLIKSKGYKGQFRPAKNLEDAAARLRIKTEGLVRGSGPIPFVQMEEGKSVFVPLFKQEYERKSGRMHLN